MKIKLFDDAIKHEILYEKVANKYLNQSKYTKLKKKIRLYSDEKLSYINRKVKEDKSYKQGKLC